MTRGVCLCFFCCLVAALWHGLNKTNLRSLLASVSGFGIAGWRVLAIGLILCLANARQSSAATNVWAKTSGSSSWATAGNWTNSFGPPGATDTALITNTPTSDMTNFAFTTARTIANLVISNSTANTRTVLTLGTMTGANAFQVTGTSVIGSNALVNLGTGSSGTAATFSNNNLFLND